MKYILLVVMMIYITGCGSPKNEEYQEVVDLSQEAKACVNGYLHYSYLSGKGYPYTPVIPHKKCSMNIVIP